MNLKLGMMDRQTRGMSSGLIYILFPIWSGFLISGLSGLRNSDVMLVVPKVILQGETLVMDCRFPANESAVVSSVKWYKGSREFFRYTPRQHPKTKVIPFSDINIQVDENQSDMNKIVVKQIPAAFRGNISCEVTTEPNYKSVYLTSYLLVAVPPARDPILTVQVIKKPENVSTYSSSSSQQGYSSWYQQGVKPRNDPSADGNVINFGDTIIATCTSGPSTPAVDLKFLINDLAPALYPRNVNIHTELKEDADSKSQTRIGTMNVTLRHDTFNLVTRKINIKCLANLFHLYNASSVEIVKELPRESSVTASSYGLGGSGSPRLHFAIGFRNLVLLPFLLPLFGKLFLSSAFSNHYCSWSIDGLDFLG